MNISIFRARHALAALALFVAYGCALESAPDVNGPAMAEEASCGSCPLGYTAISQGSTPQSGSCGEPGGACVACSAGKTCTGAGSCLDSCLRGGHEAGSACTSGGMPGKWGASPSGCVCCTGCFDPQTGLCQSGGTVDDCGKAGTWCADCGGQGCSARGTCAVCATNQDCNDGNACTSDTCDLGTCNHTNLPDGTQCSAFPVLTCSGGSCGG